MTTKKTIIFDFDGTLADTFSALIKIYNSIAPYYHCKKINPEDIPELKNKRPQIFLKKYNISKLKLLLLIVHIRKKLKKEIKNIEPIKGIETALQQLKGEKYQLGIMTTNDSKNVQLFLEKNHLEHHFDFIYSGRKFFGKDKFLKKLLQKEGLSKKDVIYVGDETRDIEACKTLQIPIVSVTWGFNSKTILKSLKPEGLAEHPSDLIEIIDFQIK